ncbi:MAG: glycosyltransferase, partial [Planctomycetota bacterium]
GSRMSSAARMQTISPVERTSPALIASAGPESYWHSEWDSGPAEAINAGLVRSTGEIVCILAADDILLPGAIDHAVKRMAREDKPKWLVGSAHKIGPLDESLGSLTPSSPASLASYLMHDTGLLPMSSSFFRRELFEDYNGLQTDLQYAWGFEIAARFIAADVWPELSTLTFAAVRDSGIPSAVPATLAKGSDYIEAAEAYANHLSLPQRYQLWRNCDERRRIYALAEAECKDSTGRAFLWQQLLRRPWWLGSAHYRATLLKGVEPLPDTRREAA